MSCPLPGYRIAVCCLFILANLTGVLAQPAPFELKIEQVTSGTKHHFFGYIGQCQTIPWNATGRYILGLEIDTIDRMLEKILPVMRQRGGYIPTCDHGVPPEVPWENYQHYRTRCVEYGS